MNLRSYLITKKIDPDLMKKAEPERYKEFNLLFSQMHPDSFSAQKLFLINKLRRKYKLEKEAEEKTIAKPKSIKPKIVPKIKK
ncbi:MAG: hypothetical protein CMB89_14080 [Flammeovirgaceae bacterium]|nr:hypothetical protein [Flammeovirgaceae bacterium]